MYGLSLSLLLGCDANLGGQPLVIGGTANPAGQATPQPVATNPINPNVQPTVPIATSEFDNGTNQATMVPNPTQPNLVPTVPVIQTSPVPVEPTINVVPPPSGQAAWAAVQIDRIIFDIPQVYLLPSTQLLWWYDPVTAQNVPLGWISGSVEASGQFQLRWQGTDALLIPYSINNSLGLTLDPSTIERIRRAGYTEDSIETFIYLAPDIVPQS